MFASLKTAAVGTVTALAIAAASVSPAAALGKRDREILLGLTTAVIIGALISNAQRDDDRPRGRVIEPEPQGSARPDRPVAHPPAASASIYRTPAATAFDGYAREERLAIQQRLKAYGYYTRGIDGIFGPGTYQAVLAFAADSGLSANLRSTADARGVYDALIY